MAGGLDVVIARTSHSSMTNLGTAFDAEWSERRALV
jgi:hypothetical protein